nr:PREDICTED: 1-acyl-sn-glycerol-3-phosphate acyltransferase epsilon [Apteryx mantelli mantelli]
MSKRTPHAAGCPTAVDTESSSYQGNESLEALRAKAPGTSQISAKEPGQQAVRKLGYQSRVGAEQPGASPREDGGPGGPPRPFRRTGERAEGAVIIYGDLPKNKENVIYLSNHQCTVDWIIADMLAIRQNALGHVRYVLKDGLKWLPLYGWYFSQHGGVYVKRSAKFNEKEMREKLRAQVKTETPMYLVIFPEGTRYNPEIPKVIADSQSFAEKEGLSVLKHVLTPRVKATHVAIDTMKDYLDAVYDVTVAYEGTVDHKGQRKLAPSMTEFLCKECPRVHIFIDRIELKDIPEEQMYMRRWLHERFEIKDKLLIEFYDAKDSKRRNKFPGKGVHSKLSLKKTLPSLLFLGGLTASMLLTESGRKLYVKTWIYGTLIGCLWVSIKP